MFVPEELTLVMQTVILWMTTLLRVSKRHWICCTLPGTVSNPSLSVNVSVVLHTSTRSADVWWNSKFTLNNLYLSSDNYPMGHKDRFLDNTALMPAKITKDIIISCQSHQMGHGQQSNLKMNMMMGIIRPWAKTVVVDYGCSLGKFISNSSFVTTGR